VNVQTLTRLLNYYTTLNATIVNIEAGLNTNLQQWYNSTKNVVDNMTIGDYLRYDYSATIKDVVTKLRGFQKYHYDMLADYEHIDAMSTSQKNTIVSFIQAANV
jgi:hypothetical protein